jgi:23S rRNA (uridine2552-2'-O)-methyltransferase
VLDLGASPGSWTLYAAERVGPSGRVIGIDLQEADVALPAHAEIRALDAFDADPQTLGGPFEVVISDMAPKTTGQRHADQYRSYELVMRALQLAGQVLRPGGTFVAKIFQGAELEDARDALRKRFDKVRIIRPKATRDESYEVFLVGLGFTPPT